MLIRPVQEEAVGKRARQAQLNEIIETKLTFISTLLFTKCSGIHYSTCYSPQHSVPLFCLESSTVSPCHLYKTQTLSPGLEPRVMCCLLFPTLFYNVQVASLCIILYYESITDLIYCYTQLTCIFSIMFSVQ